MRSDQGARRSAAEALRDAIAGGRWRPGDRLPGERDIAAKLDISRGAARAPRLGTYVADVDAVELAEARLMFEPLVAPMAAERYRPEHAEALRRMLERLRASTTDPPAFAAADVDLHATLVRATGNSVLERVHEQLGALLVLSRGATVVAHRQRADHRARHEELTMQTINPAHFAPPVGPYSQAVRVGELVFLSGQAAVDENGALAPGNVGEQTRLTIGRMRDVLAEVGAGLEHIVTATVFLADLDDFAAYNAAWSAEFGEHKPARATVRADLAIDGLVVEIQSIAHLGAV